MSALHLTYKIICRAFFLLIYNFLKVILKFLISQLSIVRFMKLRDYLKKYSFSHRDFAKKVGVSQAHISNIVSGNKGASPSLMKEIEDVTKGEVSMYDLFNPSVATRLKNNRKKKIVSENI